MERVTTAQKRLTPITSEETRIMCAFIKKLCKSLKLKSNVMCSALVFFHRFHSRHVVNGNGMPYDEYDLATACVFLACKVEENIQKLERILDVSHEIRTSDSHPLSDNKEQMWKTRERTLICERVLLDTISFNVAVDHSHYHAHDFALRLTKNDKNQARAFQQIASNILNDSLSTNLCLKYSSKMIGAAAVRLAGRFLKDRSPSHEEFLHELDEMESKGNIFGFDVRELLAVEDQLISTYEGGNGSGETTKRTRPTVAEPEIKENESSGEMQVENVSPK